MADAQVSMVSRIVSILQVFEGARSNMNLASISACTGMPKSSTYRILQQLVEAKLVEKIGLEYRLGLGIFELGSLVPHRSSIVKTARPHLQELSVAGRFAAHLAILDGTEVVYLEKVGGKFAGFLPSRVGGRFVAHSTGVGKAILAGSDDLIIERYLDAAFGTRHIGRDRVALIEELHDIRGLGYAVEHGQAVEGVSCIAAPINHRGLAIAAISICAPTKYLDVPRLKNSVRISATSIARGLNARVEGIALAS